MGRPKKEEKEVEVKEAVKEVKKISPIALDFGREDLNLLRDRVNELVEKSNE